MLLIDGSFGEGGGQIVRTALALSLLTGRALRMINIRAGRPRPGLLRQHLTAVKAAAEVSGARVSGASIGSRELVFQPGAVRPGDYRFSIGSAGSTTLVLQTILPALWTAPAASRLLLEGGTHNPHAPPADFLERSFLPIMNHLGPHVSLTLERHGFYPVGGGRMHVTVEPAAQLSPLVLNERGSIRRRRCRALVARLPKSIAERELAVIGERLQLPDDCLEAVELPPHYGPGNVVTIEIESEHVTEVFTGFGMRGVRAETVASGAADQALRYLAADAAAGEFLADQLLLPLVLAGCGSFTTLPLSQHSLTNMAVIEMFGQARFTSRQLDRDCWQVSSVDPPQ